MNQRLCMECAGFWFLLIRKGGGFCLIDFLIDIIYFYCIIEPEN